MTCIFFHLEERCTFREVCIVCVFLFDRPFNAAEEKTTVEERRATRRKRWLQRRRFYRETGSADRGDDADAQPGASSNPAASFDDDLDNGGHKINSSYFNLLKARRTIFSLSFYISLKKCCVRGWFDVRA